MFGKLSTRLAFSHALIVSLLIPLLGAILLYLLETRYFLDNRAVELTQEAALIATFAQHTPAVWSDPTQANQFIDQLRSHIDARIMLIDAQGRLLSSSLASDDERVGERLQFPVVQQALQGKPLSIIEYNSQIRDRVVDVAVPVVTPDGRLAGIVRLSHGLADIDQRLVPLRWLVIGTFLAATVIAVLLGIRLARSLSDPLSRLTDAVGQLIPGARPIPVPEQGPNEVRFLANSFNRLTQRLYDLERERRQMLASIVHELGRPLGAIKAAAQALSNGATADPALAGEFAHGIDSQVDQLRLLVDDLILLGETEIQTLVLRPQMIDLPNLIQTQCQSYLSLLQKKGIRLVYQFSDPLPPVRVDPVRLCQIIANLLHNAYKYTPTNGQITITAAVDSLRGVAITVADTGPGVAPEEHEQIFDLFYRSPRHRNQDQGMGIGLALARRLAEAHGGTLGVTNMPGQGAVFILRLPLRPDAETNGLKQR